MSFDFVYRILYHNNEISDILYIHSIFYMTTSQRNSKRVIIGIVYSLILSSLVFIITITFFPRKPDPVVIDVPKPEKLEIIQFNKISLGNGSADFWAEIRNPNDDFGAKKLGYTFVLQDENGNIDRKSGNTFILPGDKKRYILLLDISDEYTIQGFELAANPEWTQLSRFDLPELTVRNVRLGVSEKVGSAFTAFGILTNSSTVNLKNVQVIAILTDNQGKIIGVNETLVRDILKTESRDFEMIWNTPIDSATAANTTIYSQSNILDTKELLLELQQKPIFDR